MVQKLKNLELIMEGRMPSNVDEMTNTMLNNLESKTGKNLDQRIKIVEESQVRKHKVIINYLKTEYGLTYGYANLVAFKIARG